MRQRWFIVASATAVVGAVSTLPPTAANGAAPKPTPNPIVASPDADVLLDNTVETLHEQLTAVDPDLTSVIADHGNRQIVITTAGTGDPYIAPLTGNLPFPTELRVVPHSFAELMTEMRDAASRMDEMSAAGFKVRIVGIDTELGVLDVSLDDFTSEAQALARRTFGDDIHLIDTSAYPLDEPATGRNFDTSPWWGGDFTSDHTEAGSCSSSFAAHNPTSGYDNIFTAGHCLYGGKNIYNNSWGAGGAPLGGDALLGHVYYSYWGNAAHNNLDYAMIREPNLGSQAFVYHDWSGHSVTVHRVYTAQPGQTICADGAYEGEVCGYVSTRNYFACAGYGGRSSCSIIDIYDPDGFDMVGHGDSGGPAYRSLGGTSIPDDGDYVAAEGIIVALYNCSGCEHTCDHWGAGGRTCSHEAYIVDLNAVESDSGSNTRTY